MDQAAVQAMVLARVEDLPMVQEVAQDLEVEAELLLTHLPTPVNG